MQLNNRYDDRAVYYDRLVKRVVIFGAGAFFALGSLISFMWID
jgi:hypothetical protein